MDFGWKNPDPTVQNNSAGSQTTTTTPSTVSAVADKPIATPAEPLTVDTPKVSDKAPGIVFDSDRKDDAFDDGIKVDSKPLVTPDNTFAATGSNNLDSTSAPDFAEPATFTESAKMDKQPADIPAFSIEKDAPKSSTDDGKSLSGLESKIQAEKDEVSKELETLKDKVSKLDELLTKVQKMQDEEKTLITEVSSALE